MIATPLTKTVKTDPDEIQVRNLQDHQRTYDPDQVYYQKKILEELKKMNIQLSLITGEEL
jgi:hypothetical protein